MSRDDLLAKNKEIVGGVAGEVKERSPDAIVIVVTNPLDAMCHVAYDTTQFPRERVVGMAGILDSARFRTFLAWELGVSVRDVTGFVLGGHGDTMVPITSYTNVAGIPVSQKIEPQRLEEIVQRTRDGGAEGVKLLKAGSAYYAPAGELSFDRGALLERVRGAAAIVADPTVPIDEELLDAAGPSLRVVANFAVGYDNVDLDACGAHGVVVTNTPDVLTNATAELTVALMLAAARRLGEAERILRAGRWQGWDPAGLLRSELSPSTIGIVGLGRT